MGALAANGARLGREAEQQQWARSYVGFGNKIHNRRCTTSGNRLTTPMAILKWDALLLWVPSAAFAARAGTPQLSEPNPWPP